MTEMNQKQPDNTKLLTLERHIHNVAELNMFVSAQLYPKLIINSNSYELFENNDCEYHLVPLPQSAKLLAYSVFIFTSRPRNIFERN